MWVVFLQRECRGVLHQYEFLGLVLCSATTSAAPGHHKNQDVLGGPLKAKVIRYLLNETVQFIHVHGKDIDILEFHIPW